MCELCRLYMNSRFSNRLMSSSSGTSPYDFSADSSVYDKYNIDRSKLIIDASKINGIENDTEFFVIDNQSSTAVNSISVSFIGRDESEEQVFIDTYSDIPSGERKKFDFCGTLLKVCDYLVLSIDTPPGADIYIESVRNRDREFSVKIVDNY